MDKIFNNTSNTNEVIEFGFENDTTKDVGNEVTPVESGESNNHAGIEDINLAEETPARTELDTLSTNSTFIRDAEQDISSPDDMELLANEDFDSSNSVDISLIFTDCDTSASDDVPKNATLDVPAPSIATNLESATLDASAPAVAANLENTTLDAPAPASPENSDIATPVHIVTVLKNTPFDLSQFRPSSSKRVNRCSQTSGVVSIINSKKNGKRFSMSSDLWKALGNPSFVQFTFGNSSFAVAAGIENDEKSFPVKKSGNKGLVYSGDLVKEITAELNLNFSQRTSITLFEVEYYETDINTVAVIW